MSKYTRHQPVVSREADSSIDEDHWLRQFQRKLEKGAVQPRTIENSLFDQINSIMNGKSKYPSVEAAVEDMKERSGLSAYLDKIKQSADENVSVKTKVASDQNDAMEKKVDMIPIVLKKMPQIHKTLENYIRDSKGNLPVPAIIEKIRSIHKSDVSDAKDWDDDNLIRLVSKMNLEAKKNNPASYESYSNLGSRDTGSDTEIDPSNTDAFHALTPVKD
jgi:hypothetical protein